MTHYSHVLERDFMDRIRKVTGELGYDLKGETPEALVCQLEEQARARGEEQAILTDDARRYSERTRLPSLSEAWEETEEAC